MASEARKVVVIIPALNEEGAIGRVVSAVPPYVSEIIVVDNGSTDSTPQVASAAGARVVRQTERGYGSACLGGIAAAPDADVYMFLDGDGADPPERLDDLLRTLDEGNYDLVLGIRAGAIEPGSMYWHQRLGNVFMSWLIRRLSGAPVHDLASFKAMRGDALRSLKLSERRQGWTAELIAKSACRGLRIGEVRTGYRRRIGYSKVSGSMKGSALAAYRLNAAIIRAWRETRQPSPPKAPLAVGRS